MFLFFSKPYVFDGFVSDSRIAYNIKDLPNFDLAFSKEKFGPMKSHAVHMLLCSNKFFKIASSVDAHIVWKQVLLDDLSVDLVWKLAQRRWKMGVAK